MQAACSIFLAHLGKREMRLMRLSRPLLANTRERYRYQVYPVKPATICSVGLFFREGGERLLHLGACRSETFTRNRPHAHLTNPRHWRL